MTRVEMLLAGFITPLILTALASLTGYPWITG